MGGELRSNGHHTLFYPLYRGVGARAARACIIIGHETEAINVRGKLLKVSSSKHLSISVCMRGLVTASRDMFEAMIS